MPIYEYRCEEHGDFEHIQVSYNYAETLPCPVCKAQAPKILSVPNVDPDDFWNGGRYVESLGRRFDSKAEMRRFMSRNRIEDSDSGARSTVSRARRHEEEKRTKKRENVIGETVRELIV